MRLPSLTTARNARFSPTENQNALPSGAPEIYETLFVPALFGDRPPHVLEAAGVEAGDAVLAVARQKAQDVDWRLGPAESPPFPEATFDRVVSQYGPMFFEDPTRAIAAMDRGLRPGGTITVTV
ncbi:MAG: class I SAM-dependent methyltransferase [Candidatus Promineifilaceae bacterium]|nr:class I SAM-dependent methyltransferase [Candidatus Promineifilaceae bacterium]